VKAILTYHSIDDGGSPISLAPRAFEEHLAWLASGRVRVLPLDRIAAHPDAGDDAVAVTFDDGFVNAREPVERLLAQGLPVTMFVVSGHVGGTNAWGGHRRRGIPTLPLLGWPDLEHLVLRGATVAPHTRSHPDLTRVSSSALDDELLGCLDDLHARLGARSAHVAYPYGHVNDRVSTAAARHFHWGHATDFRALTHADDPLRLPRLDMYYFNAPGALESWGSRGFLRRVAWIRARRALRARVFGGRLRRASVAS
jgi:peptidoglycan/xylan/chitin deacetylase (PgdA/CDA1 family)